MYISVAMHNKSRGSPRTYNKYVTPNVLSRLCMTWVVYLYAISIPGFGIEEFPIPESRRNYGICCYITLTAGKTTIFISAVMPCVTYRRMKLCSTRLTKRKFYKHCEDK